MVEKTLREYKKELDKRWIEYEKNKNKLLKRIESYPLFETEYKGQVRDKILKAFLEKEKQEKGKDYNDIVEQIKEMDKRYEELEQKKNVLDRMNKEKTAVAEQIEAIDLNVEDRVLLDKQMGKVDELESYQNHLKYEIEKIEKEIVDMEEELKEREKIYGKKDGVEEEILDVELENGNNLGVEERKEQENQDSNDRKLKGYREDTLKDLWEKDKVRGEILELLDEGEWMDDDLRKNIKKEVSKKYFDYYDEKQGSLPMKAALFLKNELRNREKEYEEIKKMPEGEEKWERLEYLEKAERSYGVETSKEKEEREMQEKLEEEKQDVLTILGPSRKMWEEKIDIKRGGKIRIMNAANRIPLTVQKDKGGLMIEFTLGRKCYKILDVDVGYFSDVVYCDGAHGKHYVKLKGMMGDSSEKWDNKLLREYVKKKESEGLRIPKIEEMKDLLKELGEEAGITDERGQIAMLMYLTGMYGKYRLTMGDESKSYATGSIRSRLNCFEENRKFDWDAAYYGCAGVFLMSFEEERKDRPYLPPLG